jgi:phosphoribosylamine--glycine ligase
MAVVCESEAEISDALDRFGAPYVVKDDGLAAGKGVVVTDDRDAAMTHATSCERVVIEEYLDGPEVSVFCITDGECVVPLLPAQDFKRAHDNGEGPNTGGMGAYCPLPWAERDLVDDVVSRVVQPTIDEMRRRGNPYSGVLYVGLALTSRGLQVVEFNARFGDPETEAVLPLLESGLGGLMMAAATGRLAEHPRLRWSAGNAVTVVVAANGYPQTPRAGDVIHGLADAEQLDGVAVFHAGTRLDSSGLTVTSGGRVLAFTGLGVDLEDARQRAYEAVGRIEIDGAHYRTDIALAAAKGQATAARTVSR